MKVLLLHPEDQLPGSDSGAKVGFGGRSRVGAGGDLR